MHFRKHFANRSQRYYKLDIRISTQDLSLSQQVLEHACCILEAQMSFLDVNQLNPYLSISLSTKHW